MTEVRTEIPFEIDLEALSRSLHIKPESDHVKELAALVDKVREVGRPKAVYKESFIDDKGVETVSIDGVTFTSRVLRRNLDGVERVFPYIATCGNEVDRIDIPKDDFLQEFWLDAIKAQLLRSSISHVTGLFETKHKLGKTALMSPGSGDLEVWPIEQQREFFSLFGDVEGMIGVRLTDSFLMIPNKTVSGIRFQTEVDFQSCELCHREKCPSRRAPFNKELWESLQHE
ncbi:MAG: hypothetical protein JW852_03355 [Spirochaetales bacterium]|nr:hypothetical protein [Spirochaetales bacterium]